MIVIVKSMYINLKVLSLFQKPKSVWDISKEAHLTYSACHNLTIKYLQQGLVKIIKKEKSQKNPHIMKTIYGLTKKGKKLLILLENEVG